MTRPTARRLQLRAIMPIVGVIVSIMIGAGAGAALVSYSAYSARTWCPFYTGSGMMIPTPGDTGNVSPNATIYANGSVVFSAVASGCVGPYSFQWVFGDGTSLVVSKVAGTPNATQSVVHVYPGPGYYSGSLTILDSGGHSSETFFCIDASAWPTLGGGSGSSAPSCP